MIRRIFTLFVSLVATITALHAQTPPNNEIWYTTTDGRSAKVSFHENEWRDFKIVSHFYSNGKFIVRTNKPIMSISTDQSNSIKIEGSNLKTVKLPNSITEIGEGAFTGYSSLTSITIPESVTTIGESAFYGCDALIDINVYITNIAEYCTNNAISFIPGYKHLYIYDKEITKFDIPNSVTKIGADAFSNCSSLTSITIPDSVTEIGYDAFIGCSSLTSITIPDSVTTIKWGTFTDCSSLTSITIPDSITTIEGGAFTGCSSLTSITIPDSVTTIEGGTFTECSSLTSITIPDSITEIGNYAFSDCSSLTNITLPEGVKQIKEGAFAGCTNLACINFPKDITEIEEGTFKDCTNLKNIIVNSNEFKSSWVNKEIIEEITLGPNINFYNHDVYGGFNNLKRVVINTNQLRDGSHKIAASDEVVVGPNVSRLPNGILSSHKGKLTFNCKNITKELTSGLKEREVYIGKSVEYIAPDAFSGCPGVTLAGRYVFDSGSCVIIENRFVHQINKDITSCTIPNNITEISEEAFCGCSKLTNITIPNTITKFGNNAFAGCNINSITVNAVTGQKLQNGGLDPSKVVKYTGKYASKDGHCLINNGELIDFVTTEDITYTIPSDVTKICSNAFAKCLNLRGVTIHDSIKSIENGAFSGCTNLSVITIPNSVAITNDTFQDCNIDTITVSAVTSNMLPGDIFDPDMIIGYTGKFASEDGMCLINEGTLVDFAYLGQSEYTIPAGVTTIDAKVFANCISLNTLTLPDSITSIGEEAFTGCMNLKTINCMATTPPTIRNIAISEDVKICVQKDFVKVYKENPDWMVYKKQIKPYKETK